MKRASIEQEIDRVAARFVQRRLWRNLAAVWLVAAFAVWAMILVAEPHLLPWSQTVCLAGVLLTAVIVAAASFAPKIDLNWVAAEIERTHPDLETKLLAAYEQEQRLSFEQRGFLAEAVIEQARIHSLTHHRWIDTVPTKQIAAWSMLNFLALGALTATIVFFAPGGSAIGVAAPSVAINDTPVELPLDVAIEPGDVELERGTDLLVLARFADAERLPKDATLVVDAAAESAQRLPLQQSLSDPLFAVRVPEVKRDLTYRVDLDGRPTREYRVTVFDYPELERADAELNYPSYAGLPPRKIEDVRQLSVLEGTEVRLSCRLNKPVQSAKLTAPDAEPFELVASPADPQTYVFSHVPTADMRRRLELVDDRGRKNRQSVEFVIKVLPNRPPELKLVFPRQDVKVSPLQELPLEAQVTDDFGIVRWGVGYELTGRKPATVTLGEKVPGKEKRSAAELVALETLTAKPDDLLAWHVWAEDLGPDGKLRRTTSDIFFAEVSPFEEIFREASSDGGGPPGKGQAGAADEVAKLQKQIITAIWNLRRRETLPTPTSTFAPDALVVSESQRKAFEKLQEMKEKLTTPESLAIVAEIAKAMEAAEKTLAAASAENKPATLDEALPSAQAAYQGLLRLRARETRITKSKNAQGGGGQQSTAGQNLDQLELSEDAGRYETEKKAANQKQTPAQQEQEEFLKRLRELARRQEDMNQKVKELQAALDAAKNEEEKKQIERQLKRLRDEQRDLLRDVDETKNKLDQPQHNAPQAEASKQLEATRENVRQAAEALDQNKPSQALTAGTRAESELDKLREDFRKQTASRFTDEVRDLAERAKQLDERQQRLGDALNGKPTDKPTSDPSQEKAPPGKKGLRSKETAEPKLAQELNDQHRELNEVLNKAREITERAEGTEPLLTMQLYDTVREAHQKQTARAVEVMQQLVEHGLPTEAAKVEPQARQGVRQLREGIEKAAKGVLGDDVEGLRRAKQEVDRLAQALKEEMTREGGLPTKPGDDKSDKPGNGANDKKSPDAKPQAGGKPGDDAKSKSSQPGEEGKTPGEKGKNEGEGKTPGEGKQPGVGEKPGSGEGKGDQPGESKQAQKSSQGQGQQPGDGKSPGQGEKSNSQQANSPSQGEGKSPGEGKQGEGKQGQGKQGQGTQGEGSSSQGNSEATAGNPASAKPQAMRNPGQQAREANAANQAGSGPHGVLTGPDWREWSDALKNVEEFVPGVRMREDAARVREQAQALRAEAKRHSKNPNWELVRETVYEPLLELQQQLNEELVRRASPEAAVPLDRDPVPDRFGDAVRKYYERLGSGQ